MLVSVVIANYTGTTDSDTSIHRSIGHNMLFVKLSEEVHNKMPMLLSQETMLMIASIL